MSRLLTFDDAAEVLQRFVPGAGSTSAYTLGRMLSLMDFLGNPQDSLKVVHVAGTSGKTSTSYYVAALLHEAGKKVGLSVSPHVVAVNERVQINLEPLAEAEFCRELSEFLEIIAKSDVTPTYFELLVAFAYWEFAKQHVDYAVMEVGLGGLLDGTNVVNRDDKVCVITDIGLDHVNVLGNTLPEIAIQKAGIIQPKNTVFTHRQAIEILTVFQKRCDEQGAELQIIEPGKLLADLEFLPLFQQHNFTLAQAASNFALQRDDHVTFTAEQIQKSAHVHIPARMEIFKCDDKTIILDGAHNAQKLQALIESIKVKFPGQKVAALVSFADGRDYRLESSLQELAGLTDTLIITTFHKGQDLPHGAVEPGVLVKLARVQGFATIETVSDPAQAFTKLLRRPEPVLLVTGSFFLMNEVRPLAQKL
jgi:dihydrofolate synthase/folylpolyglutamate synthase